MATIETLASEETSSAASMPLADVVGLDNYRSRTRGSEGPGYTLAHGSVEVPGADEPVTYTVSLPDDPQDPHFHMFIPGFGGFKRSSRKIRTAFAQNEGIAAISYEPARHGGFKNDLLSSQKVHIDTVSAIAQDLADNSQIQEVPASHDIDYSQLVLVPHSMGGIPAVEHATKHSSDISRLIMIATVGNEPAVKLGFVPRLGWAFKNELIPSALKGDFGDAKDGLVMLSRAVKYYGSNPPRTVGEVVSCMLADKREQIEALGELGVKTALYLPESDELIPPENSMIGSGAIVDYVEIATGLNHLAPQTRYARVAADISRISQHLATL